MWLIPQTVAEAIGRVNLNLAMVEEWMAYLLRGPRIDRLLLLVAIAVLVSSLQGFAVSLSGQRRRVDPHWQRGLSLVRIGLQRLQQQVINGRQKQPWFTRIELPPLLDALRGAVSIDGLT
ncbi:MAG: hypothetical protein QUV06_03255 [Cyanobium sp. CZS 48M]|nr:hypothetical protein [Cyanobium sp. CZS48M]